MQLIYVIDQHKVESNLAFKLANANLKSAACLFAQPLWVNIFIEPQDVLGMSLPAIHISMFQNNWFKVMHCSSGNVAVGCMFLTAVVLEDEQQQLFQNTHPRCFGAPNRFSLRTSLYLVWSNWPGSLSLLFLKQKFVVVMWLNVKRLKGYRCLKAIVITFIYFCPYFSLEKKSPLLH